MRAGGLTCTLWQDSDQPDSEHMPRPLVTIISPTCNQERYVAACAECALAQSYSSWEQIFVDDGSSDRTLDVLAAYRDPRIRVIPLPHAGLGELARSYNSALAASTGSLVAILEGDDLWPSDKLEIQTTAFEAPEVFLSWGRAELIDEAGAPAGELAMMHTRAARVRLSAREAFHRLTRANFLTPTVTVMIRRQVLEDIGGFQQTGSSLLVDLPTWLWATASQSGELEFINHRLGCYRVHGAQTSQQRRSEMTREHAQVVRRVVAGLDEHALARVGWNESARRRAESRAHLAEGETALEARDYDLARPAFRAALKERAAFGDAVLALAGLLSSVVRINLVRAALTARAWVHRLRQGRAPEASES